MYEYILHFSVYGNFSQNRHYELAVRARRLEDAIRKVEKANPSYFYRGCTGGYLA